MSIILDAIVLIIILVVAFITMKRGFVKSIIGLVSLVLALVIVSALSKPVATFLYDSMIDKPVQNSIVKQLDENDKKNDETVDTVWNSLPKFLTNTAENSGITTDSIGKIIKKDANNSEIAYDFSQNVVRPTAISIITFAVNIILFIVLTILFRLLSKVICKLFKAPVLKQVNKALGLVLGVLKGIVIASLVCVAVSYIVSFSENDFVFINSEVINNTIVFSKLSTLFGLI